MRACVCVCTCSQTKWYAVKQNDLHHDGTILNASLSQKKKMQHTWMNVGHVSWRHLCPTCKHLKSECLSQFYIYVYNATHMDARWKHVVAVSVSDMQTLHQLATCLCFSSTYYASRQMDFCVWQHVRARDIHVYLRWINTVICQWTSISGYRAHIDFIVLFNLTECTQ